MRPRVGIGSRWVDRDGGKRVFMNRIVALLIALVLVPLTAATAVAQSYQVRTGDVLRVEVLEDSSLNRDALVLPDGRISLPLAGSVRAAGRTVEQIENAVTEQLLPSFAARPTVFVSLAQLGEAADASNLITVHVIGEANSPGPLQLEQGATLLQAFSAMGGFSRFAAVRRVQLRRIDPAGAERVYVINFQAIERGAIGGSSVTLREGDVILIPQRRLFE